MDKYAVYPNLPTDLLVATPGGQVTPQVIFDMPTNYLGQFWCEPNANFDYNAPDYANLPLCFNGLLGKAKNFDFTDANGNNPYTVQAVEFVGGRPPIRR